MYDTIETYIKDAQNANKSELVEIWQTIKQDTKKQLQSQLWRVGSAWQ